MRKREDAPPYSAFVFDEETAQVGGKKGGLEEGVEGWREMGGGGDWKEGKGTGGKWKKRRGYGGKRDEASEFAEGGRKGRQIETEKCRVKM